MSCKLETIEDPNSVYGEVDIIRSPNGAEIPLAFSNIRYADEAPIDATDKTFILLIKEDPTVNDIDGLVYVNSNNDFVISEDPLIVKYGVDTSDPKFNPDSILYGEFWVDDIIFGKYLLKEFRVYMGNAIRNQF